MTTMQQTTPVAVAAAVATLVVHLTRWAVPDIQGAVPGAEGLLTTIFYALYRRFLS